MRGRVQPRIWTPALRDLTDPGSSWGYDFIDFCTLIGWPLDPWQRWLAIHLGELWPDGSSRFRMALILVARQNGKTVFTRLLILYWMFVERVPLVVATNADRDVAKDSWFEVIAMAEKNAILSEALPARHVYLRLQEERFWNAYNSVYRFKAPNRRAGRGGTAYRAILDELREHRNRDAWDALIPSMNAVWGAQAVCITNEGDEQSVVLHEEYDAAEEYIRTGVGDPRSFLAAWSAPPGADPTDLEALAYANPDLGNRIQPDVLLGQAIKAKRAGGETLARFRIEMMCQRVGALDPAIDPERWAAGGATESRPALDLAAHRRRVALCYDVAIDGSHATVIAAALVDGLVHAEVVARWVGYGCTTQLRQALPDLVDTIRPRLVGWFPDGPAAAVASDLRDRKTRRRPWPPRGVKIEEIAKEAPAVCMGLADLVLADGLRHPDDPMLNEHVGRTQKLARGVQGAWVFAREGSGPIDGTYALAGAVHLARILPPPLVPLAEVEHAARAKVEA